MLAVSAFDTVHCGGALQPGNLGRTAAAGATLQTDKKGGPRASLSPRELQKHFLWRSSGACQRALCSTCAFRAALMSLQEKVPVEGLLWHLPVQLLSHASKQLLHCRGLGLSDILVYDPDLFGKSSGTCQTRFLLWLLPEAFPCACRNIFENRKYAEEYVMDHIICPQGLEHLCIRLACPLPAQAPEVTFGKCLCRHVSAQAVRLHPSFKTSNAVPPVFGRGPGHESQLDGNCIGVTCALQRQQCSQWQGPGSCTFTCFLHRYTGPHWSSVPVPAWSLAGF